MKLYEMMLLWASRASPQTCEIALFGSHRADTLCATVRHTPSNMALTSWINFMKAGRLFVGNLEDLRRISSPRMKLLAAGCEYLHLIKINCLALWLDESAHACTRRERGLEIRLCVRGVSLHIEPYPECCLGISYRTWWTKVRMKRRLKIKWNW